MFASMPVTYRANLFQDRKELHQFLLACKQTLIEEGQKKVVSISIESKPLDPLAVLDKIAEPEQLHFYVEKANQGEAIVAIDTAAKFKFEGVQRFDQAQKFIDSCLANTIATGALDLPFSGPHFFCTFTFFDENLNGDSPFPAATVFLPSWQVSSKKDCCVIVVNIVIDWHINISTVVDNILRKLDKIRASGNQNFKYNLIERKHKFQPQDVTDKKHFQASVLSALEAIRADRISKIVLAHAIEVNSPQPFHRVDSLNNLRRMYPDCYVFSTSNGKGQNFIGASPERLIRIRDRELETDALAGSAPRGKTATEDAYFAERLLRSEKERREHRVVIDFIVQRLASLDLTPQRLPGPSLLKLSNIQHLWTPIRGKIPLGVHPLEILAELHPTPAVAGDPRDVALRQIRRYEAFDRSVYAAPLGWIDHRGNSEFVVGIRSALIDSDRARLYAGAGIVAGSDPDKELAEIQLKLQALLKALV
ncbi:isochorismate synthase [Argonema galeatum]|uniref:isochorismate synthase n=1 Tax=Argonema galeatum TaxID=2942762 RepID=UPI0020115095|nr:isochorismate synthase [Argonema galeatum]MCL1466205.1 isochorismate synthase [Argonema galeatum A003/A1]